MVEGKDLLVCHTALDVPDSNLDAHLDNRAELGRLVVAMPLFQQVDQRLVPQVQG